MLRELKAPYWCAKSMVGASREEMPIESHCFMFLDSFLLKITTKFATALI